MAADKNLKIVRTHRSSYFRFATRRGERREQRRRGREKSARRVEAIDAHPLVLENARLFHRFRPDLSGFKNGSIRLRSRRKATLLVFCPFARKKERFKPVAASVQGDGLMAFVGKLRDKQGLFERFSFERSPSKKIYCYCSPFGIRGRKNVDARVFWIEREEFSKGNFIQDVLDEGE